MNISFTNTKACAIRFAQNLRAAALSHYRQEHRFWLNFAALLALLVIPSLLLVILSNSNATALLSVENNATLNNAATYAAEATPASPRYLDPATLETADPLETKWDEAEATRSITMLDDDALKIESIEFHQFELGKNTPILYFDGRPIRAVRTLTMEVTAYSPDARSCAPFDDGITASGYSVWTNGMKLIASDRRFKFGTLMSVPGYNGSKPTPVLDRGGAIKGNKLDVLFPTHRIARQWGRQKLTVTIWEYLDLDLDTDTATAATPTNAATSG